MLHRETARCLSQGSRHITDFIHCNSYKEPKPLFIISFHNLTFNILFLISLFRSRLLHVGHLLKISFLIWRAQSFACSGQATCTRNYGEAWKLQMCSFYPTRKSKIWLYVKRRWLNKCWDWVLQNTIVTTPPLLRTTL